MSRRNSLVVQIGPGAYTVDGVLHLNLRQICQHFNVPYTAKNVAALETLIEETTKKYGRIRKRVASDVCTNCNGSGHRGLGHPGACRKCSGLGFSL